MTKFLSSSLNFFRKKQILSLLVLSGIVMTGVCFGATDTPQYTEADMTKGIIEIFDLIFGLLALVLGPMVVLAGWLLSPDWTMGDFFGLRGYFREVWILVANIVYIIFALMLLYMAIMQIFGGADNEYAFKKKLGPFLVGILIVPFTWLIVSWTLSFANQAVAAVLSIPMGSISKLNTGGVPGQQDKSLWHMKVLPKQFDFSSSKSGYGESIKCDKGFTKSGTRCISPAEFLTRNQAGPFFIIMIYAYNIFKIQEADITPLENFCKSKDGTQYESAKKCTENLMGIIRDFGLSLIVTVFFAIMLVALCWVLLMRAVKLWIYIMLSPLFGLAYFTGKGFGETVGEGAEGFGQVGFYKFFQLAMVPVLVSAALAFGLLFVGVVRDNFHGGDPKATKTGVEYCTKDGVGNMVTYCIKADKTEKGMTYGSRLIIGTDRRAPDVRQASGESVDALIILDFGDSFSKIIGTAADSSVATVAGIGAGAIASVDDIFAHLILTILALVFMFMGIKMAVQYDEVTRAAFAPFAKLGESAGNFIAHSPSYLPLPHPAFAALTPEGIAGITTSLNNKVALEKAQTSKTMEQMMSNPQAAGLLNDARKIGDSSEKMANATERFMDQGKNFFETPFGKETGATLLTKKMDFLQGAAGLTADEQKKVEQFKSLAMKKTTSAAEIREAINENEPIFEKFRKLGDADMNNLLKRIGSTESAKKTLDGKELDVQKTNNNYVFNVGGEKAFEISKEGSVIGNPPPTQPQKIGLRELFKGGFPAGYSDTMNQADMDLGLKNIGIDITGLTFDQKKKIAKALLEQ